MCAMGIFWESWIAINAAKLNIMISSYYASMIFHDKSTAWITWQIILFPGSTNNKKFTTGPFSKNLLLLEYLFTHKKIIFIYLFFLTAVSFFFNTPCHLEPLRFWISLKSLFSLSLRMKTCVSVVLYEFFKLTFLTGCFTTAYD